MSSPVYILTYWASTLLRVFLIANDNKLELTSRA